MVWENWHFLYLHVFMLRAYSQGRFNPEAIFDEDNSEIAFVNNVEGIVKEFIIQEIAADTSALRKEV
jgi:hypothetical protein